jgi:hypothetical protein
MSTMTVASGHLSALILELCQHRGAFEQQTNRSRQPRERIFCRVTFMGGGADDGQDAFAPAQRSEDLGYKIRDCRLTREVRTPQTSGIDSPSTHHPCLQ